MSQRLHSFVAWKGKSLLDGKPIALLVTRTRGKANRKTGAMIQTYILRTDIEPHKAKKLGKDVSICGGCIHRSVASGGRGTCYVRVETGVLQVFRSYKRGNYPPLSIENAAEELRGEFIRIGSYGDPSAIPSAVWLHLVKYASGCTGYTHGWKRADSVGLKSICMASCDTTAETLEAQASGWRTFTVTSSSVVSPIAKSLLCPASEQAGKKLQCIDCIACGGTSSSHKASVYIPVHGVQFKQNRFNNLITIGG